MDGIIASSNNRLNVALLNALGKHIYKILQDPLVTDLMLNESGKIWVHRTGQGRTLEGGISPSDADRALRLIASTNVSGNRLTSSTPLLSATLPLTGERIAATISPITEKPTFAIRRPPQTVFAISAFKCSSQSKVFGIAELHDDAGLSKSFHDHIYGAITNRKNILIAGATGSGKTSLLSSLLQHPSIKNDRLVILEEDAREIATDAPDYVRMLQSIDVNMGKLVKHSLRYKPDRIIIGEIRSGDVAIEMIYALNTGHNGSLSTIHANSARDALYKLEDFTSAVCAQTPKRAIATAIGCVVFMENTEIREVIKVNGIDVKGEYKTTELGN